MKRLLLSAIIVAFVLVGGCAGKGDPATGSPSATTTGTTTVIQTMGNSPGGQAKPLLDTPRLNLTECRGSFYGQDLPAQAVSGRIPSNYSLDRGNGNIAYVLLEFHVCSKLGVDGRDAGLASHSFLSVAIQTPKDAPPHPGVRSRYLLEARVDNPELSRWFEMYGVKASNATVSHSASSASTMGFYQTSDSVAQAGSTVYEGSGLPYSSLLPDSWRDYYFFGANPFRDYISQNRSLMETGAGPGLMSAASGSALSQINNGAPSFEMLATIVNVISATIQPADSRLPT
jgi:hypothetical protein